MSQQSLNDKVFPNPGNGVVSVDSDQGINSELLGFGPRGGNQPVNFHFHGNNHYFHYHMPVFSNNNFFEVPSQVVEHDLHPPVIFSQTIPTTPTGYDNNGFNLDQFRCGQRQHLHHASGLTHFNLPPNEGFMASPPDSNMTFPTMAQSAGRGRGHGQRTASQPAVTSISGGRGSKIPPPSTQNI